MHMGRMPKTNRDPRVNWCTLDVLAFSATAGVLIEFNDFLIFGYAAASAFPCNFLSVSARDGGAGVFLPRVRSGISGTPARRVSLRTLRRQVRSEICLSGQHQCRPLDHLSYGSAAE